jgi:hypothetical protein
MSRFRIKNYIGAPLLGLILVACQGESHFENLGSSSKTPTSIPAFFTPTPPPPLSLQDPTDFLTQEFLPNEFHGKAAPGVKNFEQIYDSMRQLTGLLSYGDGQEPLRTVRLNYLSLKSGLPKANALNALLPTQMLNISNLANTFCSQVITNAATRAALLANSGFLDSNSAFPTMTASTLFSTKNTRGIPNNIALANFFAEKFWGSSVDTDAARASAESELATLVSDLASNTSETSVSNVVIATCTTALSSGYVIFF